MNPPEGHEWIISDHFIILVFSRCRALVRREEEGRTKAIMQDNTMSERGPDTASEAAALAPGVAPSPVASGARKDAADAAAPKNPSGGSEPSPACNDTGAGAVVGSAVSNGGAPPPSSAAAVNAPPLSPGFPEEPEQNGAAGVDNARGENGKNDAPATEETETPPPAEGSAPTVTSENSPENAPERAEASGSLLTQPPSTNDVDTSDVNVSKGNGDLLSGNDGVDASGSGAAEAPEAAPRAESQQQASTTSLTPRRRIKKRREDGFVYAADVASKRSPSASKAKSDKSQKPAEEEEEEPQDQQGKERPRKRPRKCRSSDTVLIEVPPSPGRTCRRAPPTRPSAISRSGEVLQGCGG